MTLRHLKIFKLVCDTGSMTAAAERLFISQPSVSQAIRELEIHYGTKLFERIGRKLIITESGKTVLSYARHIIEMNEALESAVNEVSHLRIGGTLTVGSTLLPKLVKQYQVLQPKAKLTAYVKNTDELVDMIEEGELDMALVEGYVDDSSMYFKPAIEDEVILVCGNEHSLYGRCVDVIDDLKLYAFIGRERGSGTRAGMESVLQSVNIKPEFCWEGNSFESIKEAVIHGLGLAVISKRLVRMEIENGTIWNIPCDLFPIKRHFSILYHKNKYVTEEMAAMVELIERGIQL